MSAPIRVVVPLLLALAAGPLAAQQLQRPQPAANPAAVPSITPAPAAVPTTPTQRVRQPTPVPQAGPVRTVTPAPAPARPPAVPAAVRDAQGRVIPGAREVVPGRAVDPATGETFRTEPVPRPRAVFRRQSSVG